MKALKSELAKAVLKDPVASRQLRTCIYRARVKLDNADREQSGPVIEFQNANGGRLRLMSFACQREVDLEAAWVFGDVFRGAQCRYLCGLCERQISGDE